MKVLVIESEHKVAQALKKALEGESYLVAVAYDSESGKEHIAQNNADVIIIDRDLAGESDGLHLVESMRRDNIHTPVLVVSEKTTIADRTAGLDAGADDYLIKPFALEELLARVRALLRRPTEQPTTVLSAGNLTLNTITYEVQREGKQIRLTSREFALLEYLMRNPGRPLSKESIITHVWDYDADVLPNTVEVYIKYLRNKVDVPFKTPLIQTVRGFGYKLDA
ncbi:MAG TPA: response regulator transcription factor [Candidatus Saccharibacteria bacterium]|nr:response regulator transcription factor [Candidatus Saccharibacteria bacterium]